MTNWDAWVTINHRLILTTFQSISNVHADALVEAQSRYGTDDITLAYKGAA